MIEGADAEIDEPPKHICRPRVIHTIPTPSKVSGPGPGPSNVEATSMPPWKLSFALFFFNKPFALLLNILFFNNFFFDFHHQFNLVRDSVPALSSFSSLPITVADVFC
jgi:hypothetical protein